MGGGVLLIVYSVLVVATGTIDKSSPLDWLAILAYALLVVGLVGFHDLQQRSYGRIGRVGLYTTIAAFALWVIFLLGGVLGGSGGLVWLVPLGVLGMLFGEVLYGAATLQARVLPLWCGILFILLMPGTILASYLLWDATPMLWTGLVWLALGYSLWSHRRSGAATGQRPLCVR